MPIRRKTRKSRAGNSNAQISNKPDALCQCYDEQTGKGCKNLAMKRSLFCETHKNNCPKAPLNGYELDYEPEKYNGNPSIYKSHNCYSYSMGVIDPKLVNQCSRKKNKDCRNEFHQPGALNGDRYALDAEDRRTCEVVEKLFLSDVPSAQKTTFQAICPAGTRKVALVDAKGKDYHWYRQDSNGMWSHKDGSNKVKNFDALKRPIFNPELASRDYRWQGSDLNYADFCGFYCVPATQPVVLGQGGSAQVLKVPKVQKVQKVQKAGGYSKQMSPHSVYAGLSWSDVRHRHRQRRRNQKLKKRRVD